ncbi:prolyl oligopeptidase family serine peptidase [Luteolibacter luteus]|uniref:Prolyl oligopeptidase family serine peptidase n=1 Tax=Luteolibacter luteus TaxID=2728835 RepID=A0A858RLX5_9BACT|nr:prolyl oligopeptidase family serine peptidase [Luteolibacter luteus]QJE97379.1 prolyl oligopeptidase family serine peptidase [Luteolibacter luteus]
MLSRALALLFLLSLATPLKADGAADNLADQVRPIPPPGIPIPGDQRAALTAEAARLATAIESAKGSLSGKPALAYLPDVQIFHKAVDWALRYDEFYEANQTAWATEQLHEGFFRLDALLQGKTPWLEKTGLIPRGYLSKIDGSVQPFGLVVPPSFQADLPYHWRLDTWFHGRGEKLSELDFIHQRMTQPGEFTPQDAIVLHPYGRYCNGQRFAGETDFFEALEVVKRDYRIDEDRIIVRGFSLGGAACWHIATHHASQWCAANPGAGFSETEEFLNFFQGEKLQPYPWERQLWNLYDSTAVARNLMNCPTVAYSGEIDKQKQAADAMARMVGANDSGLSLRHIIGAKTAHSYEKEAKTVVADAIDRIASNGRRQVPREVYWETYTLKTNRNAWIEIDALGEHWQPASIRGSFSKAGFLIEVRNVRAFTLIFDSGTFPEEVGRFFGVDVREAAPGEETGYESAIEGEVSIPSDRSMRMSFARQADGKWSVAAGKSDALEKTHDLQGPIDDAFMNSFIFVRPTGKAANEKAGTWAASEMERAIREWRRQFRGDVRVKDDTAVTEDDIRSSNLILWGDPSSNALMAQVAPKLPIRWSGDKIEAGSHSFSSSDHALICIYPNPLNPGRYVVLNSSFTFREYDYLNNARQTPKLPDWAVVDLNTAPNSRYPGAIPTAGFFGEKWELK